ncbi:hypothetical protein [Luteolibacter marinus]|uniref:hypothetical protein n=1 Tax=Luteolibacter marinus TaxID=2776705 RepID=UPI001869167E|nr:hypothetical protein [Luteolibacter marinus]
MSGNWENSEYFYLKGKRPTERQLLHLKEDLFYDGPEITDAYEASQLIDILRADPVLGAKREFFELMQSGPSWLAWEKWMTHVSRKKYDRQHWQEWWSRSRAFALDAGLEPPEVPPLPLSYQRGPYHTPEDLLAEVRQVFGLPKDAPIRVEISASSREEAMLAKSEIVSIREHLGIIDDDCQWMLARIRGDELSNDELLSLFRETGGDDIGIAQERKVMQEVKKYFVNNYGAIRSMIRVFKEQLTEFSRSLNKAYPK